MRTWRAGVVRRIAHPGRGFTQGLIADGETSVVGARHIDRGYAGMDDALRALGADITRTRIPDPAYA